MSAKRFLLKICPAKKMSYHKVFKSDNIHVLYAKIFFPQKKFWAIKYQDIMPISHRRFASTTTRRDCLRRCLSTIVDVDMLNYCFNRHGAKRCEFLHRRYYIFSSILIKYIAIYLIICVHDLSYLSYYI